jgi:YggT family protein
MLVQIATFVIDVAASFLVYLLLARFLFQWLRVPFRNPLGEFVIATTNWMVLPARRVIPALGGLDLATLALAWLAQALALYALYALRGWEFGSAPGIASAVLLVLALLDLVRYALYILMLAVVVQVVLSWVNPYTALGPVFDTMTRPLLRPIRRLVPPVANVDLSPLLLLVLLQVLLIPLAYLRSMVGAMF